MAIEPPMLAATEPQHRRVRHLRQRAAAGAAVMLLAAIGCQTQGPEPISPPADPGQSSAILAYIDGQPVTFTDLQPTVVQLAGAQALRDQVLDRALKQRLDEAGLTVTDADIQAERQRLLASLSDDPDQALRLMDQMQQERGLTDARMARRFYENAALRALTPEPPPPGTAAIDRLYQLQHGPRYTARMAQTATLGQAEERQRQARRADPAWLASAQRLPPISPADPQWPRALRQALPTLEPQGAVEIVALEEGFAVVQLLEIVPGSGVPLDQVREPLQAAARQQARQAEMRQLAVQLQNQARVIVTDPQLREAWRQRRGIGEAGP